MRRNRQQTVKRQTTDVMRFDLLADKEAFLTVTISGD